MEKQTFDDFLQDIHAEHYQGIDDDMYDDYETWLADQDTQEIIDWAQEWGDNLTK